MFLARSRLVREVVINIMFQGEDAMIYVNQKQLDQVEYILEQSIRGHHILFEVDEIRTAFENANPAGSKEDDLVTEAEKHIENLILQPTLLSKRIYLENLSSDMYQYVVRTYFNIVENNIIEDMEFNH